MRLVLFFVFIVGSLQAQELLFEGYVYDSKTKEPIPYVNLSFLNTLKGTSTDEEGHFFIDIPQNYLEKEMHISSLGYKDMRLVANQLYTSKKVFMNEDSFELDEVVVSEKIGNSYVLNPINSYGVKSGFSSSYTPWILGLYYPNIGAEEKIVEKVTVFFQNDGDYKRETSKFRIRIYDVDAKTKKPRKDLIRKSIVLETNSKHDFLSIDLLAFNIKVPREGIYIGLEWLFVPRNWYKKTEINQLTNRKEVIDRFAPTFGGVYSKDQNLSVMVYGMGEWTDFKVESRDKIANLIPAVSLKLAKEE